MAICGRSLIQALTNLVDALPHPAQLYRSWQRESRARLVFVEPEDQHAAVHRHGRNINGQLGIAGHGALTVEDSGFLKITSAQARKQRVS
jgi:hypothetical protein